MTARRVSAHRLDYPRLPWPSGHPEAEDALAADVAGSITVPHGRMHEYLRVRTAFFDRFVVTGLDAGARQVVVGGAGYDGRSLRYAAPGVRWFELDHPATQRDKLDRLRRLGMASAATDAGVRFVSADFTADPVGQLLLQAGYDAEVPALFLVEGVAVYLPPDVLADLLGQFRAIAASGSTLAISMPVTRTFSAGSRFSTSVSSMGEPALSRFEPAQAQALLARTGWQLVPPGTAGTGRGIDPARWQRLGSAGLLVTETGEAGPAGPGQPGPASTSQSAAASATRQRVPPAADAAWHHDGSGPPGLSALLSKALVAFTIETDNEAEHRLAYRTTDYGASARGSGPWLTSLVMYENCLRFLDQPRTVAELRQLARTRTNLDGVRRWGYLTITRAGAAGGARGKHPGPDAVLRATAAGQQARELWEPLPALVEEHWRQRYGTTQIGDLRNALQVIAGQLDPGLPDCLPVLGHGLRSRLLDPAPSGPAQERDPLPLHALLSRPLLAFAVEFERDCDLSLAVSVNVLRALTADGIRVRDLPLVSGISKEAVSMAMGLLAQARLAVTEPDPAGGRWKVARLTATGAAAQRGYAQRLTECEQRWQDRLDASAVGAVRDQLTLLATAPDAASPPPLSAALAPYPDGWRARVRPPVTLPRYPVVLHRGGFPDGS